MASLNLQSAYMALSYYEVLEVFFYLCSLLLVDPALMVLYMADGQASQLRVCQIGPLSPN